MQTMLRSMGLAFLLLASAGSASAMDQSAIEETNCLMACDANQEHCMTSGRVPAQKNYSPAGYASLAKLKASPLVRSRRPIEGR
jgi:hypothetical protein